MKILSFLFLFFFFVSCTTRKEVLDSFVLVASEQEIKIPIADDVKYYTDALHYFEDTTGIEYITIENRKYNPNYGIINFYRLDSCTLAQTVRINNTGPNAIPLFLGHGVLGLDNIIVSSASRACLYRVNSQGNILREYNFETDSIGNINTVSMFTCNDYLPLICVGNNIYAWQLLPMTRFVGLRTDNFEFSTSPLSVIIDTVTGNFQRSVLCFPELYKKDNNINKIEEYSRIYDGRHFVYSFCSLHDLYVTDDMESFKKYPAQSMYIDEINNEGLPPDVADIQTQFSQARLATYGAVFYDRDRGVYYRFCYMNDEESEVPQEYVFCHGDFSIQIIDSDFNVVGETRFPRGTYAPVLSFVNKDGLWISENNYERFDTDMTEDLLVFRCMKLVKK